MKEIEKIALAGLLHDIGKFYQRAENKDCEYNKDDFKYTHACLSYRWIIEHKEILQKAFNINIEELANLSAKHHNPDKSKDLEKILQIADWFSSAEREKILEDKFDYLHSVFERVSFKEEITKDIKYFSYYKLKPLSLDKESIFPKTVEVEISNNEITYYNQEKLKNFGSYKILYEEFEKELKKLQNFKDTQALNFIYYLLQKYLWCIPASTFDINKKSRHYPDISLFDHSKVLSAIATSLYDYWKTNLDNKKAIELNYNKLKEESFLLLIEGDITGIQKFIYNISKPQEIEKFSIAKALRGKSFLVSLISELLARYILKELNYPIVNALYIGGGKFQLLVANTNKNRKKIENIENQINNVFFEKFGGELGIVLAYKKFSGEYLEEKEKSFADVIEDVQILLDKKKKKKFKNEILKEIKDKSYLCPSCKTVSVEEENQLCSICENANKIGGKLPKVKYLVFDLDNKNIPKADFELGDFGKVYLVEEENINKFKDFDEILLLNDTNLEINNGFKFIGNIAPLITENNKKFFDENFTEELKEGEEFREKSVIDFTILSKLAEGDKKLAVFRADVDNLGLIFSDGLKKKKETDTHRYTISRIATLSRMLDLFFSGYINKLAEEVSQDFIKKIEGLKELNSLIYIVYSGGDDLFVIAPYNVILEFALRLRKDFYEFTAKNLTFGMSGGIFITHPALPIYLLAKFSEDLESNSKKSFYLRERNNR
ncbi:MAG: type III-A CRISPR-associated protein Cas10/Csm1, partial [Persephonella sp.]